MYKFELLPGNLLPVAGTSVAARPPLVDGAVAHHPIRTTRPRLGSLTFDKLMGHSTQTIHLGLGQLVQIGSVTLAHTTVALRLLRSGWSKSGTALSPPGKKKRR